ncbi:MAG: TonB-dependent receptor [Desulfobacterales bacterium]
MRGSVLAFIKQLVMIWLSILPLLGGISVAADVPTPEKPVDFTKFSLEELKNVEIISASKRPEIVWDAASAVYVITQEQIRRSGATSIPEVLRLAPGVHVARISATEWAVNIRGLNNQFAENLLVLMDGRSVYTHVFSGVFWDVQDTVMEDIERIEVIRGPGAALWGSNAVNGVINIITKNAQMTQGGKAVALGGSEEQIASLRYGGTLSPRTYYRAYGKFFNRGDLNSVTGGLADAAGNPQSSDNWRSGRAGFRLDTAPAGGVPAAGDNTFSLQGEAYRNRYNKEFERRSILFPTAPVGQAPQSDDSEASGLHLLGRWQHALSKDSETSLQFYVDHAEKDYDPASGKVSTADLDFQHNLTLAQIHDIVWGLQYRFISDEFRNSPNFTMDPQDLNQSLWSAFVQDQIHLAPDLLTLTLGSKFEHNEFTGLEIQPSLRLMFTPYRQLSLWTAVSRAVRVPSRLELHGGTSDQLLLSVIDPTVPVVVNTRGNTDLDSEKLTAYEFGLRLMPTPTLWFDVALFYNDYDDLIGLEQVSGTPPTGPYFLAYANNATGRAYGAEVAADWQVVPTWRLGGAYTYLNTQIDKNLVADPNIAELLFKGVNPRNVFSIRSYLNVTPQIDFDAALRFVDSLPERNIKSYTVLDARLAWRPLPNLELSLVGQNLLEEGHAEFTTLEVQRSVYGKIDWNF